MCAIFVPSGVNASHAIVDCTEMMIVLSPVPSALEIVGFATTMVFDYRSDYEVRYV